ncbi:hypothetical protein BT69DRAFT_1298030 [Atractiella rhizophila]|nr:hypothetical protein BT69DRAFT_1298030 [Atractiella rhizophila]
MDILDKQGNDLESDSIDNNAVVAVDRADSSFAISTNRTLTSFESDRSPSTILKDGDGYQVDLHQDADSSECGDNNVIETDSEYEVAMYNVYQDTQRDPMAAIVMETGGSEQRADASEWDWDDENWMFAGCETWSVEKKEEYRQKKPILSALFMPPDPVTPPTTAGAANSDTTVDKDKVVSSGRKRLREESDEGDEHQAPIPQKIRLSPEEQEEDMDSVDSDIKISPYNISSVQNSPNDIESLLWNAR